MTDKALDLKQKLEALRAHYATQLDTRLHDIETLIQHLRRDAQRDILSELHQRLHALTGSAGTFGYSALSGSAQVLEHACQHWLDDGAPINADMLQMLERGIEELKLRANQPDPTTLAESELDARSVSSHKRRLLYIIEDDEDVATALSTQLHHYGYRARVLTTLDTLQEHLERETPDVIVMDVGFHAGRLAGADFMRRLQEGRSEKLPVVFLSGSADINARLAAVRAGAHAYFIKPIDINAVVERLDLMTLREVEEAFRVLIIDDQSDLALYHATVLRSAGMDVRIVNNPLKTLETLPEFHPELLVMDVYMPGCTGVELAQVIRQQDAYTNLPIVFLSSETDAERQQEAIQSGGDEYLFKPIKPQHLISAVAVRATRYRGLMSQLQRDSLTGLFNHTATKEYLARELAQSQRSGRPVALVMLDIDHFKRVNDQYGHPQGDQVIRSLARLLRQRLRTGDIVGRYGGEEFVAILPGCTAAQAVPVVEEIRASFSQIPQAAQPAPFHVTFSAGIADFPSLDEAGKLFESADQALYRAKRDGRNRIAVAEL